jgi:hypothetical protein
MSEEGVSAGELLRRRFHAPLLSSLFPGGTWVSRDEAMTIRARCKVCRAKTGVSIVFYSNAMEACMATELLMVDGLTYTLLLSEIESGYRVDGKDVSATSASCLLDKYEIFSVVGADGSGVTLDMDADDNDSSKIILHSW